MDIYAKVTGVIHQISTEQSRLSDNDRRLLQKMQNGKQVQLVLQRFFSHGVNAGHIGSGSHLTLE